MTFRTPEAGVGVVVDATLQLVVHTIQDHVLVHFQQELRQIGAHVPAIQVVIVLGLGLVPDRFPETLDLIARVLVVINVVTGEHVVGGTLVVVGHRQEVLVDL